MFFRLSKYLSNVFMHPEQHLWNDKTLSAVGVRNTKLFVNACAHKII